MDVPDSPDVFVKRKVKPQRTVEYLRFTTGDGREAGWEAWRSHVSVGVKRLQVQELLISNHLPFLMTDLKCK